MLIQVPLLSGPSTWLLLASVLITLSLVVSPSWAAMLHGMQSGGATKPLLSGSGSGEPSARAHGTHRPKHTLLRGSHFLGCFTFSVSQSHLLLFGHMLV